MSSFTIDIERFARKTRSTVDEAARAIKIELFNSVVMDTRVDTGRLRGNWQTTTGSPARGEIERLDPAGTQTTSDVQATVRGDTVDWLTNNLPYAAVWEERDGMVARNMVRVDQIIREVVRG